MTIDKQSYRLAKHFLESTNLASNEMTSDLARTIQQAVEDWFFDQEHRTDHAE